MSLRGDVLLAVTREPMTTDELSKALETPRSTIASALKDLKQARKVCVVRYGYTGVKPVAYWGPGVEDVARPPLQTKEQRNEYRRARLQRIREEEARLAKADKFQPRRDIAASWF